MHARPFPLLAFASLLLGGMAIGFAGILMRLSDVSPVASAFWRMSLAAPLLWAWAWRVRATDLADGRTIAYTPVLLLAGIYFAGDMGLWHLSLHYTTVSNATLLSNFAPVFIALWLAWRFRTRFAPAFLVGMAIALLGAVMLVAPSPGMSAEKLLGDGLGLATAVFYAGYQLSIKDARARYSTARLMAWSTTITALILLPFALFMPGAFWPHGAAGWLPLLGLALVAQIGGQTVIAYAMAHLPAALSSVSLLIQPLTAGVAAWLLFHEVLGPWQIAGGAILLAGIWLSKRGS
jgi:drug/metabolite transporter (DMT)-like permease